MSRLPTEIPEEDLRNAIIDWRAGILSIPEIARRYNISTPVLRRRLKGIPQDGISTTRAMVAGAVAGLANPEIDSAVASTVGKGVALATDAMVTADEIFRNILKIVKEKTSDPDATYQPKDLKDLGAAAKDAMEGVRRVRELDGPGDKERPSFEIIVRDP